MTTASSKHFGTVDQPVGLNPQYCSNQNMSLNIRKQWSFSGLDYTVKDQDGKVLLRSHGHREYRTDLIRPGQDIGQGSRTHFVDHLTGMNKEIVVDWMDLMRHRGLISLRDDTGHDRTNQEKFGNGVVIGSLNDYDTVFDYTHPQLEFVPNIDYTLLAITAICTESFTG
ncbi:hypothetical protein L486_05840 [Kwoniella mangroviensis CBS 10435]|uniref:Uncharacterized protein n=1 Tax=Kwoniella mangroviensis CBS 10435 TaxID=1331196 RepID=A0A1B9INP4_9TREE|nr:hypothetical protein L486_05840 [Kwoniella mangroviensis CBS 10435]